LGRPIQKKGCGPVSLRARCEVSEDKPPVWPTASGEEWHGDLKVRDRESLRGEGPGRLWMQM